MYLYRRITVSLTAIIMAFATIVFAFPANAMTLTPGMLIKGPSAAVYYYANNDKRLVFPNLKTYQTWYPDFSTVTTITPDELSAIQLGGNVTYRPGVKLIKITTDPKVYAVATHGILRWVKTEAIATTLYGTDWNTKVEDIPDAFFVNYTIGTPILDATTYSPNQEETSSDISTDQQTSVTSTTPTATSTTPTATSTFSFSTNKTTYQHGDIVTLTAKETDPTVSVQQIDLFFEGSLIKTCLASISCSGEAQIPISGTKMSYIVKGRATKIDGHIDVHSLNLPIKNNDSNLVHLKVGQAIITPGERASAIVSVDASIAISRIDIYLGNTLVKGCATSGRECQWSNTVSGAIGTTYAVEGIVTDTIGRTYTSNKLTITVGTNDSPNVTISPAKTKIYTNETVNVTATASDNDGIASIDIMRDGAVLKHCVSAAPCTVTTGPWPNAGTVLTFTGRATDTKGTIGTSGDTTVTVVTPN